MVSVAEDGKTEDKKSIELEEKQQMLNGEDKSANVHAESDGAAVNDAENEKKSKTENKEGREVQPKKIPIGGIQMPGFFTRSKSKEKCKDSDNEQGDVEGAELLETKDKEKEETTQHTRIKLPNPFRKSKAVSEDDVEKAAEPKEKKRLLDTIRIPLVSVFPRKKKDDQNLESQAAVAGLASMETLDDTDKSADKREEELKNVALDIDEKKELQKQEQNSLATWREKIKAHRIIISALLVFVLALIVIIACAIPGKINYTVPIRDGKYVETITSCGRVEGLVYDGAIAFRGVPYARPPVGDLRFQPAHPFNKIDYCWNNTLLAHNATDTCVQIHSNGSISGVEDCLTLDVVTPYVRYDTPLPVIVLIGADSFIGGSPGKMRPSTRYARSRDVVFVRPNFRLGSLGFLAAEVLSKSVRPPTSGNYGLSDVVEALKWVQLNIENFGGDPKAVTLFGHKAGATLVTALASTKEAKSLFARAWATSGGALFPKKLLSEAESENEGFLKDVQCEDVKCLRRLAPEALMTAVRDTWRKPQPDLPLRSEDPEKAHHWLVLDGKIMQEEPQEVWKSEKGLQVPLVLGTTAHAGASEKLLLKYTEWTEELVKQHVANSKLGEMNLAEEVLKLYPSTYQGLSGMVSDIRVVCPLLGIADEMRKVTFYVVTEPRGQNNLADVDSDVDAIFGRYEPKTPEQRRYVSAMQQLFYYYVWHGEVKQTEEGKPKKILIVGQDALPADNYTHCDFWTQKKVVPQFAQLD